MSPSNTIDQFLDQSSGSSSGTTTIVQMDERGEAGSSTESLSGKKDAVAPPRMNSALKLMQRVLPTRSLSVYGMFRKERTPGINPADLEASEQGESGTSKPSLGQLLKEISEELFPALLRHPDEVRDDRLRRASQRRRSSRARRTDSSGNPTQIIRRSSSSRQPPARGNSVRVSQDSTSRIPSSRQDATSRARSKSFDGPIEDISVHSSGSLPVSSLRTRQRVESFGSSTVLSERSRHNKHNSDAKRNEASEQLVASARRASDKSKGPTRQNRRQQGPSSYSSSTTGSSESNSNSANSSRQLDVDTFDDNEHGVRTERCLHNARATTAA
jgi:hypothetical protein